MAVVELAWSLKEMTKVAEMAAPSVTLVVGLAAAFESVVAHFWKTLS